MLKTLIINGSPRIKGDTESLLDVVEEKIEGEYRVVDAYRCSKFALKSLVLVIFSFSALALL